MNDKIKELFNQAGFQYIKEEGIGWAGNYDASLPKLAELIVKECIDAVMEGDRYRREYFADKIRERFGITETTSTEEDIEDVWNWSIK